LATTLKAIGPDVVGLQEVLDEEAGQQLAAKLSLEFTAGKPDGRGIRVAFLTRATPSNIEVLSEWRLPDGVVVQELDEHGDVVPSGKPNRPALKVTIRHEGKEIDLINAHLKSKLLTFSRGASLRRTSPSAPAWPISRCSADRQRRRRFASMSRRC
jgi:endonuclease/exonuclease/phosphatase family metal-dependent hydrolase